MGHGLVRIGERLARVGLAAEGTPATSQPNGSAHAGPGAAGNSGRPGRQWFWEHLDSVREIVDFLAGENLSLAGKEIAGPTPNSVVRNGPGHREANTGTRDAYRKPYRIGMLMRWLLSKSLSDSPRSS